MIDTTSDIYHRIPPTMVIDQESVEVNTVIRAEVFHQDAREAVKEFCQQIGTDDLACVLFFCSSNYDQAVLNEAMNEEFSCPVFGCTTSGEIGTTYHEHSLIGIGLPSTYFRVEARMISDVDQFNLEKANALRDAIDLAFNSGPALPDSKRVGFVLIDGLSGSEEIAIANLFNSFGGIEIVGGSSGDYLAFEKTHVFCEGQYASNAAVFAVIETSLPFKTFKFQHFEPTEKDLVITGADTAKRVVYEIDGNVAAEEYADLLGLDIDRLDSQVFAEHPVMLEIGDQWYVRSIQKTNPDGSLTFYCAIDEGIPLTIAKGMDYVEVLEEQVDELKAELGDVSFTIGCDCILRRLEIKRLNLFSRVEDIFNGINFTGFSSYGEQFNSIHINQTLTGVAFGVK